ncbi:iron-containing alcohol dehydrogenase [Verticiella sediminum]|uniref:Iron-containing alcohol dehydrogenase n=1 Tax=Verticiella sediminum TaxID=1247510 RepID=A0A556B134_9BURK|nr:iron-containing alcohol dehydrogenase [Verticiella sediminum]TSH98854.1 iron-containing alcohol dehydrogenase [Verticiella sediminum]
MSAFEFQTVPAITMRAGAARQLGELLRERFRGERVSVVTDSFLHRSGLLGPALENLAAHGWQVDVIDDVVADPPEHVVLAAAERARAHRAQVVVGLGGGSSMDVAKLLAVLAAGEQPLAEMYGVGKVTSKRLPLVQVPTTAGTGSEVTCVSIVTTGATTKSGVVSPALFADLAVLDAELTYGLPPAVTAATGIDAMVHAIEAYTSRHKKNPLSDNLARQALGLLSAHLLRACDDGHDIQAREAMLLGAMLAGQAFANAPVAAVHALAYPLGGHFHVPHGLSNALVLPQVLRFNLPQAGGYYAELADVVVAAGGMNGPAPSASREARAQAFIDYCGQLSAVTGIPSRLRDVGVGEGDLDRLAEDAMLQTRLLVNNPREVGLDDARAIYAAAW